MIALEQLPAGELPEPPVPLARRPLADQVPIPTPDDRRNDADRDRIRTVGRERHRSAAGIMNPQGTIAGQHQPA